MFLRLSGNSAASPAPAPLQFAAHSDMPDPQSRALLRLTTQIFADNHKNTLDNTNRYALSLQMCSGKPEMVAYHH